MDAAKIAVRDCLGVALAGSREEDARIAAEIARQEGAREETSVIGQGFKTSALNGALANGTAAHALDFDHSFTMMGQPTAPIVPATFALGETLGARAARRMIESLRRRFEVTAKLVHSLRDSGRRRLACAEHVGFLWRGSGVRQTAWPRCCANANGAGHYGVDGERHRAPTSAP